MVDRVALRRSKVLYLFAYKASICYNDYSVILFSPKAKTPPFLLSFI